MSQLEHSVAGMTGGAAALTHTARAPGKTTRTQALPAKEKPEIEMTGYRELDDGLACDGKEGQTDECFLDERASRRLEDKLQTASILMVIATITALANIYLDLRTKHKKTWGPFHEMVFLVVSTAILGPLAGMGASAAARTAVAMAEAGAVKAAWTAAGIDTGKILGVLTMLSKGVRSALAHPSVDAPTDKEAFIKYLQDQAPTIAESLMGGVAAERLNHHEMLELLARLGDPNIAGRAAIEARARTLLDQFEDNRIGSIGNVMDLHGGLEVAIPVRVKVRKDEYLVLCESFGVHNSALALNGANLGANTGKPPVTMESLVFVKIVEPAFHDLATNEYRAKRKEEPAFIDFNKPGERRKHRWFDALYVDLMHRTDAHDLAAVRGEVDDQDPYQEGGAVAAH